MSTYYIDKKHSKCKLCIFEKKKSKTYNTIFRLQWHVSYFHEQSLEKIAYKSELAKMRRDLNND